MCLTDITYTVVSLPPLSTFSIAIKKTTHIFFFNDASKLYLMTRCSLH